MRVIALSTLKAFWDANPELADSKEPVLTWYRYALRADWASPAAVKADFGHASILKDGRVVFNIAGNKYRLVVRINYTYRVVYIRFLGTTLSTTRLTHRGFERLEGENDGHQADQD